MSDDAEGGTPDERLLSSQQQTCQSVPTGAANEGPCCSCMAERLTVARHQQQQQQQQQQAYSHCEDEPPPYASLVDATSSPSWSYVFPVPPYEDSGVAANAEGRPIARPLVSIPLTSYGIYKIEPPRYTSVVSPLERHPRLVPETVTSVKASGGAARKYGAILIAATVIIFLMVLSLMVRFVTEKSLWRG
ncbi:uncharacterized protein LOC131672177 [Phymastichus coffea]|uniref:uncharacterized protein LOC131672177 n=1 Tax=Phymastichus coffea TaxID=108790 RepID=UPI00273C20FB|nr:uncharacterized protein LOC131672177 [Phymastichus coffea]